MSDQRADSPQIWLLPDEPRRTFARRVAGVVGRQFARARSTPSVPAALRPASDDPPFEISGFDAPFEELERIAFHPEVARQIAGPARDPLDLKAPPEAVIPRGAEQFAARRRNQPAMVFDVMPFGFELDLLEMRILQLRDLVDRFVLVESARSFGGFRKPKFLEQHLSRFARWRDQIVRIEVPEPTIAAALPQGKRIRGISPGEHANRVSLWREVRRHVEFPPGAVILFSDLDEFPARGFVRWLKEYDVELPVRLAIPALRYHAGWFDPETRVDLVAFSPTHFDRVDAAPEQLRHLPGPVYVAPGSAHYTSFLSPLLLRAKFAMTGDWEPSIIPFLRNTGRETASMIAQGYWFERRLEAYDPEADPKDLVPWVARTYRSRYPFFWGPRARADA